MGGPGSGNFYHRPAKKAAVEDCRTIDANHLMRKGILKPGVHLTGSWAGFRDAQRKETTSPLDYAVCTLGNPPWLRLRYTTVHPLTIVHAACGFAPAQEQADYRIYLATTQPRFGGLRWWFLCPMVVRWHPCNRRVGKLYLPPRERFFGCRHCHDLTYTSCQESRKGQRARLDDDLEAIGISFEESTT